MPPQTRGLDGSISFSPVFHFFFGKEEEDCTKLTLKIQISGNFLYEKSHYLPVYYVCCCVLLCIDSSLHLEWTILMSEEFFFSEKLLFTLVKIWLKFFSIIFFWINLDFHFIFDRYFLWANSSWVFAFPLSTLKIVSIILWLV